MRIKAALLCLALPAAAVAQQPLSAIDWLTQQPQTDLPGTVLLEPPVSLSGVQPGIEVQPLETLSTPVGLVSASVTGLPVDLWQGSDATTLTGLLKRIPVRNSPAMQSLLFTLLLSETRPPAGSGDDDAMLLARLDRLMQLGAVDAAQALAQVAGPTTSAARFQRWYDATLLTGDENRACAAMTAEPHLNREYAGRIFCTARRGDWQSAALTLETAHALELLPIDRLNLLDRFLSPEIFEDAPPLPRPSDPDPLMFRLHEAIGERLPTASLSRAFATADLRDVAGWKAQIEAAERLTRIGALTPNQLLGLYTDRKPAASGGVWDRVRAVQSIEAALSENDAAAVAKTLPMVWAQMEAARLEVPFANLFSERLAAVTMPDAETAELAWRIRILSDFYEEAARVPPTNSVTNTYLAALAQGDPNRARAPESVAQAVSAAFLPDAAPPAEIADLVQRGRLGEAILKAMALYDSGARGNLNDLTEALTAFRFVGLEDTARRAALQLMLLDRS